MLMVVRKMFLKHKDVAYATINGHATYFMYVGFCYVCMSLRFGVYRI
jgi:hypothetical protein